MPLRAVDTSAQSQQAEKELAELCTADIQTTSFFESCRRLLETDDEKILPLHTYLIKPFQRLLKYPLLLEVLYKYTDDDHPDKNNLRRAQDDMRVRRPLLLFNAPTVLADHCAVGEQVDAEEGADHQD